MEIRLNNVSGLAAYQPRLDFDQTTLYWQIIYTKIEIVHAPTNLCVCTISDFLNVNKGRVENLLYQKITFVYIAMIIESINYDSNRFKIEI